MCRIEGIAGEENTDFIVCESPRRKVLVKCQLPLEKQNRMLNYRYCGERERAPSDHGTVGLIAEHAVRSASQLLGGMSVPYGDEKYAFEVYPQRAFCPDVFVDISDVLEPVAECINYFGVLYGESPHARDAGKMEFTIKIHSTGQELALCHYAALKLCTAKFQGHQCGLRFAEGYRALDPALLEARLLQEIL